MEILKDSTYEVYWETNEPADEFQIFHCPTSLDPHMGKCTAEMSVVSIGDPNVRSYLLKLDAQHQHYRFAVSANRKKPDGSIDYSGMSWVRYLCREQDCKLAFRLSKLLHWLLRSFASQRDTAWMI